MWREIPASEWGTTEAHAGRTYRLSLVIRSPYNGSVAEGLVLAVKAATRSQLVFPSVEIFTPQQTEAILGGTTPGIFRPWMIRAQFRKRTTNTPVLFFVGLVASIVAATVGFVIISKRLEESIEASGDYLAGFGVVALVLGGLYLVKRG